MPTSLWTARRSAEENLPTHANLIEFAHKRTRTCAQILLSQNMRCSCRMCEAGNRTTLRGVDSSSKNKKKDNRRSIHKHSTISEQQLRTAVLTAAKRREAVAAAATTAVTMVSTIAANKVVIGSHCPGSNIEQSLQ